MPFHRFLNHIYWYSIQKLNAKQREEWDSMLLAPLTPPKKRKKVKAAPTDTGDSGFMELLAQQKAGA